MHIHPQNKVLVDKPGILHMSSIVADGSSSGKLYREVDQEGQTINYGGMRLGLLGEEV